MVARGPVAVVAPDPAAVVAGAAAVVGVVAVVPRVVAVAGDRRRGGGGPGARRRVVVASLGVACPPVCRSSPRSRCRRRRRGVDDDDDLHPSVGPLALGAGVVGDRLGLAEAGVVEPLGRDAVRVLEVLHGRGGPGPREVPVQVVGAGVVGVAVDLDRVVDGVSAGTSESRAARPSAVSSPEPLENVTSSVDSWITTPRSGRR